MTRNTYICLLLIALPFAASAQGKRSVTNIPFQDKVTLEITDVKGKVKVIKLEWPFKGPQPVGDADSLITKVNRLLEENGVDCPPKREKVSDNIWRCGNGKIISTKDDKLAHVLNKAWGKTTEP